MLRRVSLNARTIGGYDLVLLTTDHATFNYPLIQRHAKLIVDTRGVYLKPATKVAKA